MIEWAKKNPLISVAILSVLVLGVVLWFRPPWRSLPIPPESKILEGLKQEKAKLETRRGELEAENERLANEMEAALKRERVLRGRVQVVMEQIRTRDSKIKTMADEIAGLKKAGTFDEAVEKLKGIINR